MATSNDKQDLNQADSQPTREQLRRDRISLAIVFVVFGGLIALMIWLATVAPTTGISPNFYPVIP